MKNGVGERRKKHGKRNQESPPITPFPIPVGHPHATFASSPLAKRKPEVWPSHRSTSCFPGVANKEPPGSIACPDPRLWEMNRRHVANQDVSLHEVKLCRYISVLFSCLSSCLPSRKTAVLDIILRLLSTLLFFIQEWVSRGQNCVSLIRLCPLCEEGEPPIGIAVTSRELITRLLRRVSTTCPVSLNPTSFWPLPFFCPLSFPREGKDSRQRYMLSQSFNPPIRNLSGTAGRTRPARLFYRTRY